MFKKKAAKLFMAAAVTALTVVGATGCGEKRKLSSGTSAQARMEKIWLH